MDRRLLLEGDTMHKGTVTAHAGARAVLGTVPALTADQWTILVELLVREQRNVLQIQTDKADVLKASLNARPALERYLSEVADLRECIERHTGVTA